MNWKIKLIIVFLIVTNFVLVYIVHNQNDLIERQNKSLNDVIYLLDMKINLEQDLVNELNALKTYIDRTHAYIDYLKNERR